ncbi:MAG: PEP-CTERM sorting domain-containing protein [Burkholderiaceae bacterium]
MQTKFMKRAVLGAAAVLLAGAAQAALQARDLNGDTVTDAFYDTDLNITWLRDANVNGPMHWVDAVSWADNFSFAGYTDWRLPTSDTCSGYNCTGSEMGHLYYTELGNLAGGPMTNTGGFQNLQLISHWSGTGVGSFGGFFFDLPSGSQGSAGNINLYDAMAVREGDVPSTVPGVPEPETYALMLLGLAGVAFAATGRRARLT